MTIELSSEIRTTRIWTSSLAPRDGDPSAAPRERLREAYTRFRANAALLAQDIARDLPDFTVHDVTHLDALWQIADTIVGDAIQVNSLEAFVLGGAFLIHDLGMGAAAHAEGLDALKSSDAFRRALAVVQNADARGTVSVEDQALRLVLRDTHAQYAESLPSAQWTDGRTKETFWLIEDQELRYLLGPLIGRIAYSHWWPFERVKAELSKVENAPSSLPPAWTIDVLKVAAILRCSDAAHVDQRRAPALLRIAREVTGSSRDHWIFQDRLGHPRIEGDRLVFTTPRGFPRDEASAWWLCYDTINMIDRELLDVDRFLLTRGEGARFAARGVFGAHDPQALSQLIEPIDWIPVDAYPRIEDVAGVIEALGGRALYGDDDIVPFRELIQNGVDAVRALKVIAPEIGNLGRLRVTAEEPQGELATYTIDDTGIGMTRSTVMHGLLNFGTSLWNSARLANDLPDLAESVYRAAGKFGIGFFSIFMLIDVVTVESRFYSAVPGDTLVLEFQDALKKRPLLRSAEANQERQLPGTKVRFQCNHTLRSGRRRHSQLTAEPSLADIVRYVLPFGAVPVIVVDRGTTVTVPAVDLDSASNRELARRALLRETDVISETWEKYVDNIRPLRDGRGNLLGRAALTGIDYGSADGGVLITQGGLSLGYSPWFFGYLLGVPTKAARDSAEIAVPMDVLQKWATEQAQLLRSVSLGPAEELNIARQLAGLGIDVCGFPVAQNGDQYLSVDAVFEWARHRDTVRIINEEELYNMDRDDDPVEFDDDVLVADDIAAGIGVYVMSVQERRRRSLASLAEACVTEAWCGDVVADRRPYDSKRKERFRIGRRTVSDLAAAVDSITILKRSKPK